MPLEPQNEWFSCFQVLRVATPAGTERSQIPQNRSKVVRGECKRWFGPLARKRRKSLLHRCEQGLHQCERLSSELPHRSPKRPLAISLTTLGQFGGFGSSPCWGRNLRAVSWQVADVKFPGCVGALTESFKRGFSSIEGQTLADSSLTPPQRLPIPSPTPFKPLSNLAVQLPESTLERLEPPESFADVAGSFFGIPSFF